LRTAMTLEEAKRLLKRHNQRHLLAFWNQLRCSQRQNLLEQIQQLDFVQVDKWVKFVKKSVSAPIPKRLVPAPFYPAQPANTQQKLKYAKAIERGKELISNGKVAAFVVAGGQGTRLGFKGPKGNYPISPIKRKTFFQLFAESITAAEKKYNTTCPWYIMTSPLNYAQTFKIFRSNDYYGLDPNNIFIFSQGTLPSFSRSGKILLAKKYSIDYSPDGHGGCLKALCKSGAIDDMTKRDVELISYFQVDNPLISIFDPLFIGLHWLDRAEMSSKALIKTGPKEKVGNFCLVNGRVRVIEYSDLPNTLAYKRNSDESLTFQLGSIAIHIINVKFVKRYGGKDIALPLHKAKKKISHINQQGHLVKPKRKNDIKLETFVFDALPLASKSIILETVRSQEFAPTKNRTGEDSVKIARQMMVARAADWLESAGVEVPKKKDGSPNCLIEIAPSFALDKDDINKKTSRIPKIKPGDRIYLA